MALSASDVYHLTVDELRLACSERDLDASGPVLELRRRLADHVKSARMVRDPVLETQAKQASVQNSDIDNTMESVSPPVGLDSHGSAEGCQTPVVVELLRQVSPLRSEEPEAILTLFTRLDEIFELGLVKDRVFITRILPLVTGSLMRFVGDCLRKGNDWAGCKSRLLEEYFPYFVRERLVRDFIILNFHKEGQSLRDYIERVFRIAAFLKYGATEQQLVDRVVMNFHPSILSQAAFIDRPKSRLDLDKIIGLMEEKSAVVRERQRVGRENVARGDRDASRAVSRQSAAEPRRSPVNCWSCGRMGHLRRNCPQKSASSGKRATARRSAGPRAQFLNSLRKVTAAPRDSLLWVTLQLKVGKVPALIDTGAQFSCLRSDVTEFLYLTGESCKFKSTSMTGLLADGRRCHINDAVQLHVKLLSFSWDHEFKVLREGPFPAILGMDFLTRTGMVVDAASRTFSFGFAPESRGSLSVRDGTRENEQWLQTLCDEASNMTAVPEAWPCDINSDSVVAEFPTLF
jgi:hypothetical protein